MKQFTRRLTGGAIAFVLLAPALPVLAAARATAAPVTAPTATVRTISKTIALRKPASLSDRWQHIQQVGYGKAVSKLGTSPGGEGLMWGPSYGVQVPNKTWWYADAAKFRLAQYSDSGKYLRQVKLPAKYLAQGVYFQWYNPMALADGTVVLSSSTIDSSALLLLSPARVLSRVKLSRSVGLVTGDGSHLYGFDEKDRKVRVNPKTGAITTVKAFKGQGGRSFTIEVSKSVVTVTRPDVRVKLKLTAPDYPGATVHPTVEAAMAANGRLWILLTGIAELPSGKTRDVIGVLNVDAKGNVSAVSRVRTPTSQSDPGDGKHLAVRYGDNRPTLMFIDTKAVQVYRRS